MIKFFSLEPLVGTATNPISTLKVYAGNATGCF